MKISVQSLLSLFSEHPREAGETYLEHLLFTLRTSAHLVSIAFFLLVHGICPFLFTHTASNSMARLNANLQRRRETAMSISTEWVI